LEFITTAERRSAMKEIFNTYFTSNTLAVSEEEKEKIREHFKSEQENLDPNIFKQASNEIYENALSKDRPIKDKLLLFFQNSMYKHRMAKEGGNLPDSLFTEVVNYIKDSQWKEIYNKDGATMSKMVYPSENLLCIQETALIHCNINEAFDIVWDINRRHEWQDAIEETHVVETLGPRTEIVSMKISSVGLHQSYCLAQSKKIFEDGSIVIIGCSVNHKDSPVPDKYDLGLLDLCTYFIVPNGENICKMHAGYQVNLSSYGKFSQKLMKNDWFLKHFGVSIKNLRKCLQKEMKEKKGKKKEVKESKATLVSSKESLKTELTDRS